MILLTGATGLLGSHLAVKLLMQGNRVRAVVRKDSDRKIVDRCFTYYGADKEEFLPALEWYEAELDDVSSLEDAFIDVKYVYHSAAMVSFDPADARQMLHQNPLITANVANLSRESGVEKMLYVSSVAALGRKKHKGMITEENSWEENTANSMYARSKYKAELEVWRSVQEGLNAVIVNPSIILGPGQWEKGSNALFYRIARGFKYYTEGVNAYVDVRDVADASIELMKSDISAERFILAAENLSYKELFEMIARNLGVKQPSVKASPFMASVVWRLEGIRSVISRKPPVVTRETAATAMRQHYYDHSRIEEKLGFKFRPVRQTIEEMAIWYKKDKGL